MLYENGHIINIATHLITFLWTNLITNHFSTDFIKAEFLKKQYLHIKAIFWPPQNTCVHPSWLDNPIYFGDPEMHPYLSRLWVTSIPQLSHWVAQYVDWQAVEVCTITGCVISAWDSIYLIFDWGRSSALSSSIFLFKFSWAPSVCLFICLAALLIFPCAYLSWPGRNRRP